MLDYEKIISLEQLELMSLFIYVIFILCFLLLFIGYSLFCVGGLEFVGLTRVIRKLPEYTRS